MSLHRTLHIGLAARRLQVAVRGGWPGRASVGESLPLPEASEAEPWQPAVDRLARLLAEEPQPRGALHVVLAGRFARWQLLPWRAELSRPQEFAAFAQLRFREAYGKAAEGWRVLAAPQPPGHCVPACAVDAALLDALQKAAGAGRARLASVRPYYAAAFDRWRGRLKHGPAWFGVAEDDCLTLGLVRDGDWLGLRAQRLSGDWREALPGLMAQLGIAAGVDAAAPPLFMAGEGEAPAVEGAAPLSWLAPPQGAGAAPLRLALGI